MQQRQELCNVPQAAQQVPVLPAAQVPPDGDEPERYVCKAQWEGVWSPPPHAVMVEAKVVFCLRHRSKGFK